MSSRPTPPSYRTRNWSDYNAALKKRGSLTIWFDPDMDWTPPPSGKRDRQQSYSDAAIQACLTMKVLFGMALRQTTGFVESLLRRIGLDWSVPDFSTLCRRQKALAVNIPYRGSLGPLHLLIDSTGIKAEGEGEWHARKHGAPKRRLWRKIHLGIDEETLEVRAVEITGSHVGDAAMLPELLTRSPAAKTSARSRRTVPTIRASAMTQLQTVARMRSSRLAKTRSFGSLALPVRSRATKRSRRRNTSAGPYGAIGADITAEAASRRRCIV